MSLGESRTTVSNPAVKLERIGVYGAATETQGER